MRPLSKSICAFSFLLATSFSSFAQQKTVTGKVVDQATGLPLPGVSIQVKGTPKSVVSNADGTYSVTVPSSQSVLVVSYVGYGEQEVKVGNQSTLSITLSNADKKLDEVVVVGYGTVKKRDLTGSVASVKAADLVKTPTHNAVEAMQGRVTGLDITRSSGAAGSGSSIRVRGNRSIGGGNDPLYIVDGYQVGSIDDLNTNDIESIDVLKDASSTAIYGAMGANGVIIVTTKKGREGKVRFSYNGYYGVNQYTYPKSRIGEDYLRLRREAWRTTGDWASPADDAKIFPEIAEWNAVQAGQWVDWVDLINNNGIQNSHSLSMRGGSEKTKVYSSIGYFREQGMLRNNDFTRFNARLNLDQTINKWAKAGVQTQVTYGNQNNRRDPMGTATSLIPLGVPYDANGVVNTYPMSDPSRISPLADEKNAFIARDNNIRTNILANGYLELTPLKGLSLRSNFGSSLTFNRRGIYNDRESLTQVNAKINSASSAAAFSRFLNWDNVINYTRQLSGHSVTLTGITSFLKSDVDNVSAAGTGQILSSQLFYDLNATNAAGRTIGSPYVGWTNMAYAGRLNYGYRGKYLLTMSGRYDGASRLSEGRKWDFFPSAAASWNISQEPFLQDIKQLSNLKLRASYGITGNYSTVSPYGTQSGLLASTRLAFGEVPAPMYQFKTTIGNPNLTWEKSATLNAGLDFGLFANRISATVDAYHTHTWDILYLRMLPQSSGVASVFENIAETKNRGIEVSVTSQNIKGRNFNWSSTVTFSRNKEEITSLPDNKDLVVNERESLLIGHPVSSFYSYNKLGIWQLSEEKQAELVKKLSATGSTFVPGDIKLEDRNGDNIIDATNDRGYIGSTVPAWVAGFQNSFSYKAFDLNVFLFARYGQTVDALFLGRFNPGGMGNGPATLNYWTPENPTNDFPRPKKNESNLTNYIGYQSLNFVDGSFFKVKNVSLGYTLPQSISQRFRMQKLRVYATGNNLFIKAKSHLLKDYDPETGGGESSPVSRQFVFGVNLDF
ncbi:TonB-dependent receptor [Paraflavisolibacter sp. H34]|uniref:SusC/RagA family TonB-linked outer membrane protein n=1 Tax=Huijunlia imazamoxiresistens TaxID=3127457 RepID=UPI00301882DE